jgi:hypothetical protein
MERRIVTMVKQSAARRPYESISYYTSKHHSK